MPLWVSYFYFWTLKNPKKYVKTALKNNFGKLHKKDDNDLPKRAKQQVSIGWEDEEGDLVTISCDEELAYALQCKKR